MGKKPDSGGYYGGDRPPSYDQREFDKIPDATPKHEPLSRTGNNPYIALGKSFTPLKSSTGYVKRGVASWYGTKFHGRRTSSGETYDMWGMTAAHPILPLPTYVEVSNLVTGKKIVVKVNDRGPFLHNRIIDLSFAAAHKLGIADKGTGLVEVKAIDPDTYRNTGRGEFETNETPGLVDTATSIIMDESAQQPQAGNYFIQVGAYSNIDNAMMMRETLTQHGHAVYPKTTQQILSHGEPYRVQVGPFPSIDTALQIKANLEQLLGQVLVLIEN